MRVILHKNSEKEYDKLDEKDKETIFVKLRKLELKGFLSYPDSRKLNKDLYEIRVKSKNLIRVLYGYVEKNTIAIVLIFIKKSKKISQDLLETASNRLKSMKN